MLYHSQRKADEAVQDQASLHPLDDQIGSVRLLRYMGSDATIVQAARVSYGEGTKTLREDRKLLKYLWDNKHTSPFEQVVMTFHINLPIFLARQMVRHRTARLNEVSARYSEMPHHYWVPAPADIREQKGRNKQGSEGQLDVDLKLYQRWQKSVGDAHKLYRDLLEAGVAREQARTVLPVSLYTSWTWQCDLRNLIHFLQLRDDSHAQLEMQRYARALKYFAGLVAPETIKIVFPPDALP